MKVKTHYDSENSLVQWNDSENSLWQLKLFMTVKTLYDSLNSYDSENSLWQWKLFMTVK